MPLVDLIVLWILLLLLLCNIRRNHIIILEVVVLLWESYLNGIVIHCRSDAGFYLIVRIKFLFF